MPASAACDDCRLRLDVGARLNIFKVKQDVTLVDAIAFFHGDVGDLADALAQNVGVVLGANLARGGDDRGEVSGAPRARSGR